MIQNLYLECILVTGVIMRSFVCARIVVQHEICTWSCALTQCRLNTCSPGGSETGLLGQQLHSYEQPRHPNCKRTLTEPHWHGWGGDVRTVSEMRPKCVEMRPKSDIGFVLENPDLNALVMDCCGSEPKVLRFGRLARWARKRLARRPLQRHQLLGKSYHHALNTETIHMLM